MSKKLTLSKNRLIGGVCGGLAEYFGMDPTVVRILYLILTLFSAGLPGVILYVGMWIVMPFPED